MISPYGAETSKIMIVGEGPSRGDAISGSIFAGQTGKELIKMLNEAGISQADCFFTSVSRENIPGWDSKRYFNKYTKTNQVAKQPVYLGLAILKEEILRIKPNIIIALGELPLWALTSEMGITKWRGSILEATITNRANESFTAKLVPTYAPEIIARKYDWRFIAVHDLKRAEKEAKFPEVRMPEYQFQIRPTFGAVVEAIGRMCVCGDVVARGGVSRGMDGIPPGAMIVPQNGSNQPARLILSGDIETRKSHISCFGFAWTRLSAICIPFACVENTTGFWNQAEELAIILALKKLFLHPNIGWVFQNGIYDYQYFAKHWGFIPNLFMDTMLAHHTCWAGLPKGLDFQSSLYCEFHRYWKDEGKEFHEGIKTPEEEEKYWVYNCKDCVTTFEIATILPSVIKSLDQEAPAAFQHAQFLPVLKMMLRGIKMDRARKSNLAMELFDALAVRERLIHASVGRTLNPRSPKQMKEFFYEELNLPPQVNRKTKKPTTDSNALEALAKKEPLIAPLVKAILEFRSIGVFLSTFVKAPLDTDSRMRCSYNIAGTETYRWSSSSDAFGTGMNLQNVPKGNED